MVKVSKKFTVVQALQWQSLITKANDAYIHRNLNRYIRTVDSLIDMLFPDQQSSVEEYKETLDIEKSNMYKEMWGKYKKLMRFVIATLKEAGYLDMVYDPGEYREENDDEEEGLEKLPGF